jgi:hypothetical protein
LDAVYHATKTKKAFIKRKDKENVSSASLGVRAETLLDEVTLQDLDVMYAIFIKF